MDTWPKVEKENALFSFFGHKIDEMFSPKSSVTIILSWGNKWTKKERLVKKKKKGNTERWEILSEKPLSWLVPFSGLQFLVCDGPRFACCTSKSLLWILVLTGFALSAYYQEFPCGFWPFNKWVRMTKSSPQEFFNWRPIHGWIERWIMLQRFLKQLRFLNEGKLGREERDLFSGGHRKDSPQWGHHRNAGQMNPQVSLGYHEHLETFPWDVWEILTQKAMSLQKEPLVAFNQDLTHFQEVERQHSWISS